MTTPPFHLAWFCNFVTEDWNGTWGSGGADWTGGIYVELARALERACFDYMILEDKSMVSDAYGGTFEADCRYGITPKHDPVPLIPLLAQATSRLGLVPTMSTSFYPPFLLARLASTLDHMSRGRMGWNIVTSGEDLAAQNYGMDKLHEHDLRYDMADEYVDLVCRLWESWEADALVMDRASGTYADGRKVHRIDFEGKFYRSRGPLNTLRPPQGRPVFVQAGASPRGRDFAARHADTIIAVNAPVPALKEFRDDVRRRAAEAGRSPDDIKVLFLLSPIVGATMAEAEARVDALAHDDHFIGFTLAEMASITEIDFSAYPLDEPLPELTTNGERGTLISFTEGGRSTKTLRQLAARGMSGALQLVGTPDSVAARMGEVMAEVGGDGFLVTSPTPHLDRVYIAQITDGLVPALQRRGLTRTGYDHEQFRDNLLAF